MKTQIVPGSYNVANGGFFLVPPIQAKKPVRVDRSRPSVTRAALEPIAAKRISACEPAQNGHSDLPVSLKDWLVCKEAREISQENYDLSEESENGNEFRIATAKPAARGKNLSAAVRTAA